MLRSVRSRVVLLTIAVAMAAVVSTAWLATRNVESSLRDNVSQGLESDVQILQSLTDFAISHPSWDGVDQLVAALARTTGRRIALVRDGDVVVDSDELQGRDPAPLPPAPSAVVDPTSPSVVLFSPIVISGAIPGTIESSTGLVVCGATIGTTTIDGVAGASTDVIQVAPADGSVAGPVVGGSMESASTQVSADVPMAPRAQLYLGRRAEDPLSLSGSGRWRTMLIVGIVLAVAAALAWVLGRQLTRPLDELATAAHRVRSGDLTGRVHVPAGGELGEVARAFNSMASSLETSQQQRRRMTSDIAHELRNPLVTINGTLEAIQDGIYEPDASVIASLVDETEHLRALVDDLQQLALAESGGLVLQREEASLVELVEQVIAAHRSSADAAGVVLERAGTADAVATVDVRRVRQVLANLVSNAVRHTPAGGSVTVQVDEPSDAGCVVRVIDTGEGITPDDLPHVFDRFWRADPSRTRESGGAGLGLAISHELVRVHGGRLDVESVPGAGSTFIITLPR